MSDLNNWTRREIPGNDVIDGTLVRLEPFDVDRHIDGIFKTVGGLENATIWKFMPRGPYATKEEMQLDLLKMNAPGWSYASLCWISRVLGALAAGGDMKTVVIVRKRDNVILGHLSFMRLRPEHGSVEIGTITFAHSLQRTTEATETLFRVIDYVMTTLKYRRLEWKCNSRNEASNRFE
jgi:RimJ/RimL family protein N-acetyltransferase